MSIDEKAEIIAIAKEKCGKCRSSSAVKCPEIICSQVVSDAKIEYYQKRKEAMEVKELTIEEISKACEEYAYCKCYGCTVPVCGACFINAVKQAPRIIERQEKELKSLRPLIDRDIVIVGRRQGKEAESREIICYRVDLIREAAVEEVIGEIERALNDHYHKDVCMGDTVASYYDDDLGDDVAEIRKKYLPKECPDCKRFVGCEKANWVRGCEEYREDGEKDYFTPEEVRAMSQDEVRANYFKILNSMSKWH